MHRPSVFNKRWQILRYVFSPKFYVKLKAHFFSICFVCVLFLSISLFLFLCLWFSLCINIYINNTYKYIYIYLIFVFYIYNLSIYLSIYPSIYLSIYIHIYEQETSVWMCCVVKNLTKITKFVSRIFVFF